MSASRRQGRVVVQVGQLHAAEHELRRRRGDGGAEVDQFELRVVAGHHPGADVVPLLEGHIAPGLVAGLAGRGHRPLPPEFLPGQPIERDHDAGFRAAPRPAASSGNHPATGDDRTRTVRGGIDLPVQDLRLPDHLAGLGVQGEGVVVVAVVQDQTVVDRDVAVVFRVEAHLGVEVAGQLARVAPDEISGRRVHRLDHVVDRGDVEDAVVGQRCDLGCPDSDFPRPGEAESMDVLAVDLVEGAVTPTVQRAAEHQPLRRRRVLQHFVRDRHERRRRILGRQCGREPDAQDKGRNHQPLFEHASTLHCSASVSSPSSGQGGDSSSRNGADSERGRVARTGLRSDIIDHSDANRSRRSDAECRGRGRP